MQRSGGETLGAAIWIDSGKIRESFGADAGSLSLFSENGELVLAECTADKEGEVRFWRTENEGEKSSHSPSKDGSISKEARSYSSGEIAVQKNGKLLGAAVWIPAPMLGKALNAPFESAEELSFATEKHGNGLVLRPSVKGASADVR